MNILLDLDGTLTDPREGIVGCIKHALARLGEPCPPDESLERFIGPPLAAAFAVLLGGDSPRIRDAIAAYRERFATIGLFENRLYPEIPGALAALVERGHRLFIATSKPTIYAERIADHFGLRDFVGAVHGSELDGTRAGKPELIAEVLRFQGLPAAETVMVGDREHDVIGARANGLLAIGALWGYGSRDELVAAGASALCERPGDLAGALASLGAAAAGSCSPGA
ncbi:MAG: HAD hydrolase-like protein [Burkholderiales bacterium]